MSIRISHRATRGFVMQDRVKQSRAKRSLDAFRTPESDEELERWLKNMVWHHRFTISEVRTATGLSADEVGDALDRFDIRSDNRPQRAADAPLLVLPYPGGRHPRVGFIDGCVRPQRETKLSVFAPWGRFGVRRARRAGGDSAQRRAVARSAVSGHTRTSTPCGRARGSIWNSSNGRERPSGGYVCIRTLPNGVIFSTTAQPHRDSVRLKMELTNGSDEPLSNLRVQNCVMLKGAPEFAQQTDDNKFISAPYVAVRSAAGNRWVITAWEPCERPWTNPPCPCMHSDPQFADCAPGESDRLQGWLSFYEGTDIEAEIKRIDATGWRAGP